MNDKEALKESIDELIKENREQIDRIKRILREDEKR